MRPPLERGKRWGGASTDSLPYSSARTFGAVTRSTYRPLP